VPTVVQSPVPAFVTCTSTAVIARPVDAVAVAVTVMVPRTQPQLLSPVGAETVTFGAVSGAADTPGIPATTATTSAAASTAGRRSRRVIGLPSGRRRSVAPAWSSRPAWPAG
jgi:hypothetical protein